MPLRKTMEAKKNKVITKLAKKLKVPESQITRFNFGKYGEREKKSWKQGHFIADMTEPVKTFCEPLGIKVKEPVLGISPKLHEKVWEEGKGFIERKFKKNPNDASDFSGFYGLGTSMVKLVTPFRVDSFHLKTGAHETIHSQQLATTTGLLHVLAPYSYFTGEQNADIPEHLGGDKPTERVFNKSRFELSMLANPKVTMKKSKIPGGITKHLKTLKKQLNNESEQATEYMKHKGAHSDIVDKAGKYPLETAAMARKAKAINVLLGEKTEKEMLAEFLQAHQTPNSKKIKIKACSELAKANAVLLAGEHVLSKTPENKKPFIKKQIKKLVKESIHPLDLYWEILKLQKHLE
ncbi:hypothetical protein K8R43_03745 [archaeon]|nr:hypothetical protein [archaeon]